MRHAQKRQIRTRMLIVDDNELILELVSDLIMNHYSNYEPALEIRLAKDGAEGLEIYREWRPDLVITDIRMPKMTGLAMAREIRSIQPDAKIIVISAFTEVELLAESIDIGVNHYVQKPLKIGALSKAIDKILGQISLERVVVEQHGMLRHLAFELMRAEEKERREVAVKLHDYLIQNLALALINLEKLGNLLPADGGKTGEALGTIRALLGDSIEISRDLTFELSPPILFELGLEPAIEWLIDDLKKKDSASIRLDYRIRGIQIKDDLRIFLYRVIRELIMNAMKHGHAKEIRVSLDTREDSLRISVANDGIGFDPDRIDRRRRFGLFSIEEKLHFLNGRLEIRSDPDEGTSVTVTLPQDSLKEDEE